jgi:hypothetical protein
MKDFFIKFKSFMFDFVFREDNVSKYLWSTMSNFIFDDIFLTAAQAESVG